MHINELDYDILYRVFRIINHRTKWLTEISSACRYWRRLALPHLYNTLNVTYVDGVLKSDVKHICSNGYAEYVRELCIILKGVCINSAEFIAILNDSGIEQETWLRIKTLHVYSSMNPKKHGTELDVDPESKRVAEDLADILHKHLPHIKEVSICEGTNECELDSWCENPVLLVPELVSRYSAQLCKVSQYVSSDWLSRGVFLPQPLTHMTIDMRGLENRVLTKVFAPTLRYLGVSGLTPDITWSWFSSGNDEGDDIWFASLLEFDIGFYNTPDPSYHNSSSLLSTDQSRLRSEYRSTAKRVHFPVLRRLSLYQYPFMDDSFCSLFVDCPLVDIDIDWYRVASYRVQPQILSRVSHMVFAVDYDKPQSHAGMDGRGEYVVERNAVEGDLARLMSAPSAVYSASIALSGDHYKTACPNGVTLPHTIAWHSIRKLSLCFDIGMRSVFTVLAELPRLQYFRFAMSDSYLQAVSSKGATVEADTGKYQRVVNRDIDRVSISQHDGLLSKTSLAFLLSHLLPLVPSLVKLEVGYRSVKDCKEIMCDPSNHLEWISGQLEII